MRGPAAPEMPGGYPCVLIWPRGWPAGWNIPIGFYRQLGFTANGMENECNDRLRIVQRLL